MFKYIEYILLKIQLFIIAMFSQKRVRIDIDCNGQITEMQINPQIHAKDIIQKLIGQNCCDSLSTYFRRFHRTIEQSESERFKLSTQQKQIIDRHLIITTMDSQDFLAYNLETPIRQMITKYKLIKIKLVNGIQQDLRKLNSQKRTIEVLGRHNGTKSHNVENNNTNIVPIFSGNLQQEIVQGDGINFNQESDIKQQISKDQAALKSQQAISKLSYNEQTQNKRILLIMRIQDRDQKVKKRLKVDNKTSINENRQNIMYLVEDVWQNWNINDQICVFYTNDKQICQNDLQMPLNHLFGNIDQVQLKIIRKFPRQEQ